MDAGKQHGTRWLHPIRPHPTPSTQHPTTHRVSEQTLHRRQQSHFSGPARVHTNEAILQPARSMSATPEPTPKEEVDKNKIEIKVAFPNEAELTFRVKRTTPFGKIYDSIAAQKDISVQSFSLSYDGERITREANPKMLEMNDGDQIDVQLTQVGGRR